MIIPLIAFVVSLSLGGTTSAIAQAPVAIGVTPETLEEYVAFYFADIPVMVEIARCESRMRHLDTDGEVVRGSITPKDVGVMQINEHYHLEQATELGYDIHSLEGNLAYARYLYEKQGVIPWLSSAKCWKPAAKEKGIAYAR
jgi:hypothetical protein